MNQKCAAEKKLLAAVAANPDLKDAAAAWDRIAKAQKKIGQNSKPYNMLEAGRGFNSQLFGYARHLLRAADERPKPNGERLSEFTDSRLPEMEDTLFAEEPVYDDFETVKLTHSLTALADEMNADSALVKKVLAGKSPAGPRGRADPGHQVERRGPPQEVVGGGQGGRRRRPRPHDRPGPFHRCAGPRRAQGD